MPRKRPSPVGHDQGVWVASGPELFSTCRAGQPSGREGIRRWKQNKSALNLAGQYSGRALQPRGLSSLCDVAILCVSLLELDSWTGTAAQPTGATRHGIQLCSCAPVMARKFIRDAPRVLSSMAPPAGKPEMTATDFQGCAPWPGKKRQPPSKKKIVQSGQRDLLRCTNKKQFDPKDILLRFPLRFHHHFVDLLGDHAHCQYLHGGSTPTITKARKDSLDLSSLPLLEEK